jgi:hypothetical protein
MVKRLVLLLCLVGGCRTWDVRAFDVPLNGKERYMTASSELSSEEKVGVIIILGVAIGAGVAIALAD